jgi:hypothetical protein
MKDVSYIINNEAGNKIRADLRNLVLDSITLQLKEKISTQIFHKINNLVWNQLWNQVKKSVKL